MGISGARARFGRVRLFGGRLPGRLEAQEPLASPPDLALPHGQRVEATEEGEGQGLEGGGGEGAGAELKG